jgi:hypothetical protein
MVREVLKVECDMSYRKILVLSPLQNSDKNMILRQQWAIVYLGILKSKKRIINIDESWLGKMNYTRRIWAPKGSTHSIPIKQVSPRISLIVALDNLGGVYACLT